MGPVGSLGAIESHELFDQLNSRFHMHGAEKMCIREGIKAVTETLENRKHRGALLAGTLAVAVGEVSKGRVAAGMENRWAVLKKHQSATNLDLDNAPADFRREMAYAINSEFEVGGVMG